MELGFLSHEVLDVCHRQPLIREVGQRLPFPLKDLANSEVVLTLLDCCPVFVGQRHAKCLCKLEAVFPLPSATVCKLFNESLPRNIVCQQFVFRQGCYGVFLLIRGCLGPAIAVSID